MKKGIFIICALFVVLTGFNQQERVVEQGNADLLGRASVGVEVPAITQGLKGCSINEGGIATFIVRFTPSSCTVKWYKETVELENDGRINIYTKDGMSTLVIDNLVTSDAGVYKVVVKNAVGEAESRAELVVRPE